MIILLEILAIAIGLILLLIFLILVCRTRIALRGEFTAEHGQLSGELALLNGLVTALVTTDLHQLQVKIILLGLPLPIYKRKIGVASQKAPKPQAKPTKPKPARRPRSMTSLEWLDLGKGILRRIKRVIRFERIQADLTVGLATPDQTGLLLGAYYFLSGAFNWGRSCQLRPDFQQKRLEGWIEAALVLHLLQLIPVGLFILKRMQQVKKAGGDDVRGIDR